MNITKTILHNKHTGSLKCYRSIDNYQERGVSDIVKRVFTLSEFYSKNILPKESIVLILTSNRIETVEILLATFNSGLVAVPVSPLIGDEELSHIIENLKPTVVFIEGRVSKRISNELLKHSTFQICLKKNNIEEEYLYYESLVKSSNTSLDITFNDFPPDTIALLIHTSGSEGEPKVIQMTHVSLENYFHHHNIVYSQYLDSSEPETPVISIFPYSHLAGITTTFQGLLMSRPTIILSFFDPILFLTIVEKEKIKFFALISSMFAYLAKEIETIDSFSFNNLKVCVAIGEPCAEPLAKKISALLNVQLLRGYGLTECLPGIIHSREDILSGRIPEGSCGKLLFGQAKLIDENGLESNHMGSLRISNSTVNCCYLKESLNIEIIDDGWYQTKDLFRKDSKGHFYHIGRTDDMFISHGKNIYPQELEKILLQHPKIYLACVSPVFISNQIGAGALINAKKGLSINEIYDYLLEKAPSHLIPKVIKLTDDIPQIGIGKVDRKSCIKILQQEI